MNRRTFFGALAGAAVAPVAGEALAIQAPAASLATIRIGPGTTGLMPPTRCVPSLYYVTVFRGEERVGGYYLPREERY